MPVFRAGSGQAPAWCELHPIRHRRPARRRRQVRLRPRRPQGEADRRRGRLHGLGWGSEQAAGKRANIDLFEGEGAGFSILEVAEDATLIRMAGDWGDEVGGLRAVLGRGGGPGRPRRPGGSCSVREADPLRLPLPRLRRVLDPVRRERGRGLGREELRGVGRGLRGHRHGAPPRLPARARAGAGGLFRDHHGRGEAPRPPLGPHPRKGAAAGGAGLRRGDLVEGSTIGRKELGTAQTY